MPRVIRKLEINEVALCPEGMNQEAKITLFKSKDSPSDPISQGGDPEHKEGGDGDKLTIFERIRRIFKGDLNEELERAEANRKFWDVVDAFYESVYSTLYNSDLDEAQKAQTLSDTADQLASHMKDLAPKLVQKEKGGGKTVAKTFDDVLKGLDKESQEVVKAHLESLQKGAPTDPQETIMKGLPEDLRKQWEQMQEDLKVAKDRNQRADIRARVSDLSKIADLDVLVDVIKAIEDVQPVAKDSETPTISAQIEAILRTANERVAQAGLFKEFGHGKEVQTSSALKEFEDAVAKIRKENPGILALDAQRQVLKSNPDLYNRYLAEKGGTN